MTAEEVEAITGGYHGDAFRVLGPHAVRKKGGQPRWEVRAFLPQAESAEVVAGDTVTPMVKQHAAGFFCVALAGEPRPYRIRVRLFDGSDADFEDPYRFPPIISDFDLHLHSARAPFTRATTCSAPTAPNAYGVAACASPSGRPNAEIVTLVGDFNDWDTRRHPMRHRNGGVWEIFIPELGEGVSYKYNVRSRFARLSAAEGGPVCIRLRGAAEIRFRGGRPRPLRLGRRRSGWSSAP